MEGVVVLGLVEERHVEGGGLVLDAVADVVNQTLREDVVVDAVKDSDEAVEQKNATKERQILIGNLRLGDGIHKHLDDLEVDKGQQAQERNIDDFAPKTSWRTGPDQLQSLD